MTVEHPSPSAVSSRHSKYWSEDGSLVIRIQHTLFKISPELLSRHSPVILKGLGSDAGKGEVSCVLVNEAVDPDRPEEEGKEYLAIRTVEQVQSEDFDVLLQTLLDDAKPESWPFTHTASLIRISSPHQLDVADLYTKARLRFETLLPAEPLVLAPETHPLYEGLEIAERYGFPKIRNAILYILVTTHHFVEDDEDPNPPAQKPVPDDFSPLSPHTRTLCTHLMHTLIAHFTPTLYTVASAGHMACTDTLAEHWMTLVILPSLSDDGVYKPVESLERIKEVRWEEYGMCEGCCREKRREWGEEQGVVWARLGEWVGEAERAVAMKEKEGVLAEKAKGMEKGREGGVVV